jgi:hypothetical protein
MKNPIYPRMTAVVGDDNPKLIAPHSGRRAYFPHVVCHGNKSHPYDDQLTVNSGGNQTQQKGDVNLESFDRLALLLAAAPDLHQAAQDALEYLGKIRAKSHGGKTVVSQLEAALGRCILKA